MASPASIAGTTPACSASMHVIRTLDSSSLQLECNSTSGQGQYSPKPTRHCDTRPLPQKKDETIMGKMDAQNIFQKKRFTDSHLQKETPPELPVLHMNKITTESSSSRTVRAKPQSPLWIGSKLSFRVSRSSGRASEAATRATRAVAPRRYRTMKFCHFLGKKTWLI